MTKRYFLSIVEESIMNPKFKGYSAGRIELHDRKSKSPYAIEEYRFCIPSEFIDKFRDLFDFKEIDKPIKIEFDMFKLPWEYKKYYGK
jgi:hypothetical protein